MPDNNRGLMGRWANSIPGRIALGVADRFIPGNAFNTWDRNAPVTFNNPLTADGFRNWAGFSGGNPIRNAWNSFRSWLPGGGADRNYQGPPSLAAGGEPPAPTFTEDDYDRATSAGHWDFSGGGLMSPGQSFNASMPGHWRRTGTSASWGGQAQDRNNQAGNSGNRLDSYMMSSRGTIQRRDALR